MTINWGDNGRKGYNGRLWWPVWKRYWRKWLLNKPFINSYLASCISVEAKYCFLIHFINFRNKRPNKNPQNGKIWIFGFLPTLNKPFIKSYFASSISGEVKYYLLTHLITFRNKNPKWQNLNFWFFQPWVVSLF